MKLQDLDAGKPMDTGRRMFVLAAAMYSVGVRAAPASVIMPAQSYMGARLLQRPNMAGMPEMRPDTFGVMTMFVFPVAVASTSMDIYVADAGQGVLYRYDPSVDAMAVIPGVRVTQQTRLAALPDGSVMVANGGSLPAKRFSRGGRLQQNIDPQLGASYYDEIVGDANTGRYYGLDRVQGRLEEIMPHGRGAIVLPYGLLPDLPVTMAMDSGRLYVAGRACGCVVAIDLFGSTSKDIIAENLGNVAGIAAADGWLVVSDSIDRQIRIYKDGILRSDPTFQDLRLVNPQGMSITSNQLFVADPGSRRIATFRLRA